MSTFLVNLAQRGAGLPPVTSVQPPVMPNFPLSIEPSAPERFAPEPFDAAAPMTESEPSIRPAAPQVETPPLERVEAAPLSPRPAPLSPRPAPFSPENESAPAALERATEVFNARPPSDPETSDLETSHVPRPPSEATADLFSSRAPLREEITTTSKGMPELQPPPVVDMAEASGLQIEISPEAPTHWLPRLGNAPVSPANHEGEAPSTTGPQPAWPQPSPRVDHSDTFAMHQEVPASTAVSAKDHTQEASAVLRPRETAESAMSWLEQPWPGHPWSLEPSIKATPAPEPPRIQVRIGRVEVRVTRPPVETKPTSAREPRGFGAYGTKRRALGRNWY